MKAGMDHARRRLEELLESDRLTAGMVVRTQGDHLVLARGEEMDSGEMMLEDRVRLTSLPKDQWGLSVKRHTGRWERTPFSGSLAEMVEVMHTFMQHLVAS
jgi:hypothetical protein